MLSVSVSLLLLIMAGMVTHLICKFFIVKVIRKVFFSSHKQGVPLDKDVRLSQKLSNFVPVIVVYNFLQFMPGLPENLKVAIQTICGILFFVYLSIFFNEVLEIVNNSYSRKSKRKNHSIKGYIQIGKILVHIIAAIMILAIMSNKSPDYYLLAGCGRRGTDVDLPAYSAVAGGECAALVQRCATAGRLD